MSGGIKVNVEAALDPEDMQRTVKQFTQAVNKMGEAIARANKTKFSPVDKVALEDMKKMQAQFESLLKINGALRDRMRATGQTGASFANVDWGRLYDDPSMRGARAGKAFEYVAAGTSWSGRLEQPDERAPGGGGRGGGGRGGGGNVLPFRSPGVGGYARQALGAGLQAAGPVGSVANGAVSAAVAGGPMAGLAGLAGGLVALGIGKAVSAVMDKLGDAQQEAIAYDTLKRSLGDVNVSFNALQESIRSNALAMHVSIDAGQKMAAEFVKLSGATSEQYKTVAEDTKVGIGFGRATGMEPEAANRFFAQMRQSQVTSNPNDSKALAVLIGEAVGKSGQFSKMDEILSSLGSFVTSQTRNAIVSANAGGYLGGVASLLGKAPGLDAGGTLGMLNTVNASIQHPDSEAFQNALYRAVARPLGLSPIQMQQMQEGGMYATGRSIFGGSLETAWRAKNHLGRGLAPGANSDESVIDLFMRDLKGYAPEMRLSAMQHLGLNIGQAKAFDTYFSNGGLGKLSGNIGNEAMGKLSTTSIEALGRLQAGGMDVMRAQDDSLMGRTGKDALTSDEIDRLAAARANSTSNPEEYRKVLEQLTALRDQEKTLGRETADSITDASSLAQIAASKLLDSTNAIRDAATALARFFVGDYNKPTPEQLAKDAVVGESGAPGTALPDLLRKLAAPPMTEGGFDAIFANILKKESGNSQWWPSTRDGHTAGDLQVSRTGAIGIAQIEPGTGPEAARLAGVPWSMERLKSDPEYNKLLGRAYAQHMYKRFNGDAQKTMAAYHNGERAVADAIANGDQNNRDWTDFIRGPDSRKYIGLVSPYHSPMPSQGSQSSAWGAETRHNVHIGVTLNNPDGSQAAPPVEVQTVYGRPIAGGVR